MHIGTNNKGTGREQTELGSLVYNIPEKFNKLGKERCETNERAITRARSMASAPGVATPGTPAQLPSARGLGPLTLMTGLGLAHQVFSRILWVPHKSLRLISLDTQTDVLCDKKISKDRNLNPESWT